VDKGGEARGESEGGKKKKKTNGRPRRRVFKEEGRRTGFCSRKRRSNSRRLSLPLVASSRVKSQRDVHSSSGTKSGPQPPLPFAIAAGSAVVARGASSPAVAAGGARLAAARSGSSSEPRSADPLRPSSATAAITASATTATELMSRSELPLPAAGAADWPSGGCVAGFRFAPDAALLFEAGILLVHRKHDHSPSVVRGGTVVWACVGRSVGFLLVPCVCHC